jgi:2'-5' RNA ligase
MPYAIELYFDAEAERAIREFRDKLTAAGVRPVLDELGDRPHVSLALVDKLDAREMEEALRNLAGNIRSFSIIFSGVDSFSGNEGVIYLSPAGSKPLLAAHAAMHQILVNKALISNGYYLPGHWVPHCTVAYGVDAGLMGIAIESAKAGFRPMEVMVREIRMAFYRPVRPICSFELR